MVLMLEERGLLIARVWYTDSDLILICHLRGLLWVN